MRAVLRDNCEFVVGYQITTLGVSGCASAIMSWINDPEGGDKDARCRWLACLNPHSYAVSRGDGKFADALADAELLLPDGIGVVFASRILGGQIRSRITGADIFSEVLSRLDKQGGGRIFFLGSTDATLGLITTRIARDYPDIRIVGSYSPPFKDEYSRIDTERMIAAINDVSPDILWVGLTAPKQEKWIFDNRERLDVRFAAAIGAVFDFYAGNIKRSHPFFRRAGLEWLPRLVQEPRRLWRRMVVSAPIFVWRVIRDRFRRSST